MNKPFKCGLLLGRFQPLHLGHCNIISKASMMCEKLIIAIGSADKFRTQRNPFTAMEREMMIKEVFKPREFPFKYIYIEDQELLTDEDFYKSVLVQAASELLLCVDAVFTSENSLENHFSEDDKEAISFVKFPRNGITGTSIRELIRTGYEYDKLFDSDLKKSLPKIEKIIKKIC